jgi:hypothetical protein
MRADLIGEGDVAEKGGIDDGLNGGAVVMAALRFTAYFGACAGGGGLHGGFRSNKG